MRFVTVLSNRVSVRVFRRLVDNTSGVTAIEYGLIAALIAVAAIVMITSVGTNLTSTFSEVAAGL